MERRRLERNKINTRVYVSLADVGRWRARAKNLSASGVFIQGVPIAITPGSAVDLVFAVDLGKMVRLHRRKAIVVHNVGGLGMAMRK